MTSNSKSIDGTEPAHPNALGRDSRGRFQRGNALAATHALHAVELPAELRHLRDEVGAFEAACLVDEGDDEQEIPARRRSLLSYRARIHRRILQLDDAIELRGLVDRRGRLRVAWLQQLAALIEKARTLDVTLGLARRPKRIPTLAEVLNDDRDE